MYVKYTHIQANTEHKEQKLSVGSAATALFSNTTSAERPDGKYGIKAARLPYEIIPMQQHGVAGLFLSLWLLSPEIRSSWIMCCLISFQHICKFGLSYFTLYIRSSEYFLTSAVSCLSSREVCLLGENTTEYRRSLRLARTCSHGANPLQGVQGDMTKQ